MSSHPTEDHLKDLEERYFLLKKEKFLSIVITVIFALCTMFGVGMAGVLSTVRSTGAKAALREIQDMKTQAAGLAGETGRQHALALDELKAIRRARTDAPYILDTVVPDLGVRLAKLEAEPRSDIIRFYRQDYGQHLPERLEAPAHVQGGVVAAIVGVHKPHAAYMVVTADIGVASPHPKVAVGGAPSEHDCVFRIVQGDLYTNDKCHGPLSVAYLYRAARKTQQ